MSNSLSVDLRRRAAGPAASPPPAWLFATPVTALQVDLSSFTFASAKSSLRGSFHALLALEGRRPLSVATNVLIDGRRLNASLTADTDLLHGRAPTYVDVVGRADLGPRGRARAAFRIRREPLRYAVSGNAEITPPEGALKSFRLTACRGSAPMGPGASRPDAVELACRYELAAAKKLAAPFGSVTAAAGRVSLSAGRDETRFHAALKADLEPVTTWGRLSGELTVRAEGRRDRPWKEAALSRELKASVKVPRFEELVAFLRDSKYSVPPPIHVLKGPLTLALDSRGDLKAARQTLNYAFASDLSGPRQRLVLRAKGGLTAVNALTPARTFEHDGELLLEEVALEAPRLELQRAPKVLTDKRIKTGDETAGLPDAVKAGGGAFRTPPLGGRLVVKTGKPMIVFSNLAKGPIPAVLDLVVAFAPVAVAGKVEVRKFDVELFRRNATIDHFNVALTAGSSNGALEGLVLYKTPTAAISIRILGTTEKPRVEFTSVPPMKREDIIALLIFGKNPDELDPEQTASVNNTETALESRAFGLASLYLFGVTPVEHVGYDSATNTTSVRFRLPGGANLTLGSDFEQNRQLTVRKPLSPHWAIQSEFTDQGRESKVATTFLEWFMRY